MVNNLPLTPAGLALLDMLEQQTGVSFEVVHLWMDPVRQSSAGEFALAAQPVVADEVAKALRTGEVRLGHAPGVTFGIFPLRREREVIGCLIASHRESTAQQAAEQSVRLQEAGALGRGILESDLLMNGQLAGAEAVTRRLHATLRFVGQLGTYETDRQVMHAVLHAANVWFDLDCRIYERRLDGRFVLTGALPGLGRPGIGEVLEADRAAHLVAARRFPSAGDMEDLGLANRNAEVLALPVGIGEPAWLILLSGSFDTYAELTFAAIARVLTADLQGRELARIERWHRRLTQLPFVARATPERAIAQILLDLMDEVDAQSGRLTAVRVDGTRQVLAVVARPDGQDAAQDEVDPLAPDCHLLATLPLGLDAAMHLELSGQRPLGPSAQVLALSWLKGLQPWIAELAVGLSVRQLQGRAEKAAFHARIEEEVERAHRFSLGLGLVLIGGTDAPLPGGWAAYAAVAAAVRSALRACDVLGLLPTGEMAVLLLHSDAEGAAAATDRLLARLAEHGGLPQALHVGRATLTEECNSADQLVAVAAADCQQVWRA